MYRYLAHDKRSLDENNPALAHNKQLALKYLLFDNPACLKRLA